MQTAPGPEFRTSGAERIGVDGSLASPKEIKTQRVGHLNEGGSITLVSGSPARKAQPGQTALSAVGGAVEAMVRSVAKKIAPRHRINVVSPGIIDTPMMKIQGAEREALFNKMTRGNLIPRAGTPEEAAQGMLFLIKNDFVTGTTVDVDGGTLLS
jgi:NAD(P)-dependent dehydrogenase (short-subunit alcohol dehydrogenase family)